MRQLLAYYIKLRWILFLRKLSGHGIKPIFASIVFLALIFITAFYLPERTESAGEIVAGITLYFVSMNMNSDRNRFLQFQFGKNQSMIVNALEALLTAIPGILINLLYGEFLLSALLLIAAIMIGISNFSMPQPSSLPTPYRKIPFEFMVGFRTAFWTYLLVIAAMAVGYFNQNANLSFFSLIIISFTHIGYFQTPEKPQWVIIFMQNASGFLWQKCKQAFVYHNFTLLPFAIIQMLLFNESLPWILILLVLSNIYLMTTVFLKYSSYPNEVQITDGIVFAASLVMPPLLLLTIPVLLNKSKKHLNSYL